MPVTPQALHAHQKASGQPDSTKALLQQILEQQKAILAALERLAQK